MTTGLPTDPTSVHVVPSAAERAAERRRQLIVIASLLIEEGVPSAGRSCATTSFPEPDTLP